MAEGKEHALAIGLTTLSTEDMWVLIVWLYELNIIYLFGLQS